MDLHSNMELTQSFEESKDLAIWPADSEGLMN